MNLSSIINVFIITIPLSEHLWKAERCTKMAAGKRRAVTSDDSSTCRTKRAHYRRAEETRRSCYYARHVVHCQCCWLTVMIMRNKHTNTTPQRFLSRGPRCGIRFYCDVSHLEPSASRLLHNFTFFKSFFPAKYDWGSRGKTRITADVCLRAAPTCSPVTR